MFGNITMNEEEKGLFTFYRELEFQEQKLAEIRMLSQRRNLNNEKNMGEISSMEKKNEGWRIRGKNKFQSDLSANSPQTSIKQNNISKQQNDQTDPDNIKLSEQTHNKIINKFLEHCVSHEKRYVTKQSKGMRKKIKNKNKINKSQDIRINNELSIRDSNIVDKTMHLCCQIGKQNKKPKPIAQKIIQLKTSPRCTQNRLSSYIFPPELTSQLSPNNPKNTLELPKLRNNKILTILKSIKRQKPSIIHKKSIIHEKKTQNKQNILEKCQSERLQLFSRFNLPDIPQSVITSKRRKKMNTKYLQHNLHYPLTSIIKVRDLESDLIGLKQIPACIDMNYNMPAMVSLGWSERKKQILLKILQNFKNR